MSTAPASAPVGAAWRAATALRLERERFDVLIVGGGATGAAIARDAALRGLRVALCERSDYAAETSSYSSKLIHGGLRYLEHGELPLVFEALSDRDRLLRAAPHLCRPVDFVVPGYRGQRPYLFTIGVGIALYNALARWRPPARRERLSPDRLATEVPLLRREGLRGAYVYVDCQTDDARLVLEHILDAESAGAACLPYAEMVSLDRSPRGHVRGATILDRETGRRISVTATTIVLAVGPFADAVRGGSRRLRPTLGVHVVVDGSRLATGGRAFLLRAPEDGRVFFVLPAGPRTLIGTTDTDWRAPDGTDRPPRPGDRIEARAADVRYLLDAANANFPGAALVPSDVLATFAGLRPLLSGGGDDPSAASREHAIWTDASGLLTIAGGKLTTMRSMGEEATDRLLELLRARGVDRPFGPCLTRERPLPGGKAATPDEPHADADVDALAHPARTRYGTRASEVLALARVRRELASLVDAEVPVAWAEVLFAARHERATDLSDVFRRRLPLFRLARDQGIAAAERAASLVGAELAWSAERTRRAVVRYLDEVDASRAWRDEVVASG